MERIWLVQSSLRLTRENQRPVQAGLPGTENTMNDTLSHAPVDELSAAEYIKMYKLGDDDVSAIRKFGKFITADMAGYMEQFYVWLREQPEFEQFFYDEQLLQRVTSMQATYWTILFEALDHAQQCLDIIGVISPIGEVALLTCLL